MPNSGPVAGGGTVYIYGQNLTGTTTVDFGSISAAFTVMNDLQIDATVPAEAAGIVDVTATNAAGTSALNSQDQYTYVALPTVSGVSPAQGPTSGGQTVTITGTGFGAANMVFFGMYMATFTVNSPTQITATSPIYMSPATVDITVQSAARTSGTSSADLYTYVSPPVNHAPIGTANTVTTLENAAYTFATANFGFTDPNDSPPNNFKAVEITTLPSSGTLTDNGVAVTAGEFIAVGDINAGHLVFTPANYSIGAPYASFSFQVQDDGGTANGGADTDPSPKGMTVDVTRVNQAPIGTANTVTTLENTAHSFALADFGFTDPHDSPANNFKAVEITTLPNTGTLSDSGAALAAGAFVSVGDIGSGLLVYTPATNNCGSPYPTFTFQVQDDGGTANGGVDTDPSPKIMALNITDQQITNLVGANLPNSGLQNVALAAIAGIATFTDPAGPDPVADYTATIHWGDNTTSTGTVVGTSGNNFRVDAPAHTYAAEGAFTETTTVTHDALAPVTSNAQIIVVGGPDYWIATGPDPQQTIASWSTPADWSLNRVPLATDDVIFDFSRFEFGCTIPLGMQASAASVTFEANLPGYSILTVNGTLQTSNLEMKARAASGGEVTIAAGAWITITGYMSFAGGNISGGGSLVITAAANTSTAMHIEGLSPLDPPTIGVPLTLGGSAGLVTMDYSGLSAVPLVVIANASITVNNNASVKFDNRPLAGATTATAITNGDGGAETIYVYPGGYVSSDGNYQRLVGMGVIEFDNVAGVNAVVEADAGNRSADLEFTGITALGVGLMMWGGFVHVEGAMTFDREAILDGGIVLVEPRADLTLGVPCATSPSYVWSTEVQLRGTLTAHGGLNMTQGTLDTLGDAATIEMDNGNTFELSGGTIKVTNGNAVGTLTIYGNFSATGGRIQADLDTSADMSGSMRVYGDVNLDPLCTFSTTDLAAQPVQSAGLRWNLFSWTGTRTGMLSVIAPMGWTSFWDDSKKFISVIEPN